MVEQFLISIDPVPKMVGSNEDFLVLFNFDSIATLLLSCKLDLVKSYIFKGSKLEMVMTSLFILDRSHPLCFNRSFCVRYLFNTHRLVVIQNIIKSVISIDLIRFTQ